MTSDYTVSPADVGKVLTINCCADDVDVLLPLMDDGTTVTIRKLGHNEMKISAPHERWNSEE